jgi:Vitamin K epoxide reductase family
MTRRAVDVWTTPPGWSHNPTSFRRRALLAGLSGAGLLIAVYLVLYQFRLYPASAIVGPWDSPRVLDATYPVPDAFAGVLAYGAELLLLALGGRDRWRSLPWTCLALAAILATGAVVSIGLIIVQPTVVGAWCIWCLGSAAISLALFFLGFGEGIAALQHVRRARAAGVSLGDAVWGRAAWVSEPDMSGRRFSRPERTPAPTAPSSPLRP